MKTDGFERVARSWLEGKFDQQGKMTAIGSWVASYETMIATMESPTEALVSNTKYSNTTTMHQNCIKRVLSADGWEFDKQIGGWDLWTRREEGAK